MCQPSVTHTTSRSTSSGVRTAASAGITATALAWPSLARRAPVLLPAVLLLGRGRPRIAKLLLLLLLRGVGLAIPRRRALHKLLLWQLHGVGLARRRIAGGRCHKLLLVGGVGLGREQAIAGGGGVCLLRRAALHKERRLLRRLLLERHSRQLAGGGRGLECRHGRGRRVAPEDPAHAVAPAPAAGGATARELLLRVVLRLLGLLGRGLAAPAAPAPAAAAAPPALAPAARLLRQPRPVLRPLALGLLLPPKLLLLSHTQSAGETSWGQEVRRQPGPTAQPQRAA